jgi:uncharacterized protein DUF4355
VPEDQEPQGTSQPPQGDAETPEPQDSSPAQDWQALARKWEKRAKSDAARLAQMEQRVKTLVEPEAVADKDRALAEAQAEAQAARLDALRYRIAAEVGVPLEMAPRLLGEDEEALRADAKELSSALTPKPPKRTDAARGTGDNGGPPQATDPNVLLRTIVGVR